MENLKTLIRSLSSGEEKLIRHFYKLREFGEYRKREQLLDILLNEDPKTEAALAQKMGYKVTSGAYHNIKSRLKSDIACVLLMQESSCKFNTQFAQAMFSCRRSLLTGELLLSRGVYKEGLTLLKKAARIAEKYELYAERIMTEDTLRSHYAGSNDIEELQSGTEAIEENYRLLGQMLNSKSRLYQTVFSDLPGFETEDSGIQTERMLNELERLESSTGSSRVSFYSKLSRLNVLHNAGNLSAAICCGQELLSDIAGNPVIMSTANKGGIHLELANLYLRVFEPDQAELHASEAVSCFKKGMVNHLRASTLSFYAQVQVGKYTSAAHAIECILNSKCLADSNYEVLGQRINLVAAWFSFAVGDSVGANARFRKSSGIAKDKGIWYYGYSVLEILLLLDKNAVEAASYKIDALRKSIARSRRDEVVERTQLMISVLRQLLRAGNDYTQLQKLAGEEIQRLANTAGEARWDPTGFEVVSFHTLVQLRSGKIAAFPQQPLTRSSA